MNIKGKTVLLTGANGGIGACVAYEMARAGAALVLTGRDENSLRQLRQSLHAADRHHTFVCDLQQSSGVNSLLEFCSALPAGIDLLVNNAGMSDFAFVSAADPDVTRALIELNLTAPITLTAAFLPHLLQRQEAAVINVGSVFGSIGYPGFAIYGASKSGLKTFSQALRRELADSTVRVLYVAPRATRTAMNSSRVIAMNQALGNAMDPPEKVAKAIMQRIQTGHWGDIIIGWPERLFAAINSILPRLTDAVLLRQLPRIRQHSRVPAVQSNTLFDKREAI
ncbi:MAG: SDR family oxidoreductase [Pseudohongiella sp.]|nr:SDR family oxidoreductase [Pseudohongiella sp.]MDO9520757.1 SDR family oxidoreductase [Pseudohongiella sp.]MDP2126958.1 SDR family oxidoreductase [Pseudohongiella sp.]